MTSQLLSAIAGIVLSLAFAYIPPLKKFFDSIESDYKRTVMGAAIILVGIVSFGLSCGQIGALSIACTQNGAWDLGMSIVSALVANQSIYQLLPGVSGASSSKIANDEAREK